LSVVLRVSFIRVSLRRLGLLLLLLRIVALLTVPAALLRVASLLRTAIALRTTIATLPAEALRGAATLSRALLLTRVGPDFRTAPGRDVRAPTSDVAAAASTSTTRVAIPPDRTSRRTSSASTTTRRPALAELRHKRGVLGVETSRTTRTRRRSTRSTHARSTTTGAAGPSEAVVQAPTSLATITGHVARAAAEPADNVGGVVALFRAVILAVTDVPAILADLVLVIAKRAVECGELAQLVPLMVVLTLGGRGSLSVMSEQFIRAEKEEKKTYRLDDLVDQVDTGPDLLHIFASDKTMEFFLGIVGEGFGPCLALLDGALSADTDLRPGFTLHLFERVTTRANQKTEEIDLRELLDRDVDLFLRPLRAFLLVVFDRRAEVGVVLHSLVDELDALVLQLLTVANLTGVRTTTMPIVGGRRRR
jgi:hypothetical protein